MTIETKKLCINADLGEGSPWDEQIMPLIHTCNIACGGHAGNSESIKKTILLAKNYSVTAGAHPSYPDSKNFGRVTLNISGHTLKKSIISQIFSFLEESDKCEMKIHHIKLHGALYHDAAYNIECAKIVLDAFYEATGEKVLVFAPCQSPFVKLCTENNWPVWQEAFIDRNYEHDYHLTSRKKDNALIVDSELCFERLHKMIFQNQVITASGETLSIFADTFCIHGDEPYTVDILKYIHEKLSNESFS